jgi:hypothetical protein
MSAASRYSVPPSLDPEVFVVATDARMPRRHGNFRAQPGDDITP